MASNSFFDKAKVLAQDLGAKAKDAAVQNSDKIDGAVGKAADFADKRTKGKYRDKIDKAESAARKAVTKLEAEKARDARRRPVTDPPVADPDPGMERPTSAAQPTAADPDPVVATPAPAAAAPEPTVATPDPIVATPEPATPADPIVVTPDPIVVTPDPATPADPIVVTPDPATPADPTP